MEQKPTCGLWAAPSSPRANHWPHKTPHQWLGCHRSGHSRPLQSPATLILRRSSLVLVLPQSVLLDPVSDTHSHTSSGIRAKCLMEVLWYLWASNNLASGTYRHAPGCVQIVPGRSEKWWRSQACICFDGTPKSGACTITGRGNKRRVIWNLPFISFCSWVQCASLRGGVTRRTART